MYVCMYVCIGLQVELAAVRTHSWSACDLSCLSHFNSLYVCSFRQRLRLSDQIQLLSCSSLSSKSEAAPQRWAQACCLGSFAWGRHRRWDRKTSRCMARYIESYRHIQSYSDFSGKEILFDRVYGWHSRTEKESVCINADCQVYSRQSCVGPQAVYSNDGCRFSGNELATEKSQSQFRKI